MTVLSSHFRESTSLFPNVSSINVSIASTTHANSKIPFSILFPTFFSSYMNLVFPYKQTKQKIHTTCVCILFRDKLNIKIMACCRYCRQTHYYYCYYMVFWFQYCALFLQFLFLPTNLYTCKVSKHETKSEVKEKKVQ